MIALRKVNNYSALTKLSDLVHKTSERKHCREHHQTKTPNCQDRNELCHMGVHLRNSLFMIFWQDHLQQFWTFGYAEQSAAHQYQKHVGEMEKPYDKKDMEQGDILSSITSALSSLSGWEKTLRPGQCDSLQLSVSKKLCMLCDARLAQHPDYQSLDITRLSDLCFKAKGICGVRGESFELKTKGEKLQELNKDEIKGKRQADLDNATLELLQNITEETMDAFCTKCQGLKGFYISEACGNEKDRGVANCDFGCLFRFTSPCAQNEFT